VALVACWPSLDTTSTERPYSCHIQWLTLRCMTGISVKYRQIRQIRRQIPPNTPPNANIRQSPPKAIISISCTDFHRGRNLGSGKGSVASVPSLLLTAQPHKTHRNYQHYHNFSPATHNNSIHTQLFPMQTTHDQHNYIIFTKYINIFGLLPYLFHTFSFSLHNHHLSNIHNKTEYSHTRPHT
jgi:hypothetical protein